MARTDLAESQLTADAFAQRWRPRFPILADCTYLVTHSLGAMPETVRDRLRAYADQWATRGVRAWAEGWWDSPVTVGNLLGRILNAPPGTVAMHQNVSVIQSIVASALQFTPERNRVVYTDQNFPTNMYVWEGCRRSGAEIVCVKSPDGIGVPTEALLEAIDERTRIVPISHVLYKSSWLQDAAAICARAREVGALVLLDSYQAAGTVPIDVQALGVDMLCGGSVKWLCGGPGAGYLYVRPDLLETLEPRITGWAAHAAPFAFERGAQRYASGAARLLNGSPAVPALMAASAGYEIVLEVGVEAIRSHSLRLTDGLREDLLERGFELWGPVDPARRGGSLTVRLRPDEHGPAFVAALERRRILVDHRPDAGLRVSPHFYTRADELREFAEVLAGLRDSGSWKDFVGGTKAYSPGSAAMQRTFEWSAPDGGARRGRLEPAAGAGPHPAALVAHEGAGAFAELLARALAASGWSTLCLQAEGLGAATGDRARTAELETALGALARDPEVEAERVAIVGIGALGAQAFLCACASRRAAAVVDVCGALVHEALDAERPVQPLDMLLNLSAPALIVHAEEDERFGTTQASSAVARIERALRSAERISVPGRAADFLDPTSAGYHAHRAERAAASIAAFLRALSDEP